MVCKIYTCGFKYCRHDTNEVKKEEAVKVGNRYLHVDCAETKEYIMKTKELYCEEISSTVVMKLLVSVINQIVIKKKVDAKYLYFALSYAINHRFPIRSPYGLHYLVDHEQIKNAWNKKKIRTMENWGTDKTEDIGSKERMGHSFHFTSRKNIGFGDICKGE